MPGLIPTLLRPAGDAMQRGVVLAADSEPLIALATRLRTQGSWEAIVVDADGQTIGLLTAEDLLHRALFVLGPDQSVGRALARRTPTCRPSDPLYLVLARMRRDRLPAVAVVDAQRRPLGIVGRDASALPVEALFGALARAANWQEAHEMPVAKAAQAELAAALLSLGESATAILDLISTMNGELMREVLLQSLTAMAHDGWGVPPVEFAMIVMGSVGRHESLLRPDQDNGFILADYPDSEHGRIDPFFIELAERLTRNLASVGFPLCAGNVMATNPLWRKSLSQWRAQISQWARSRSNTAILLADIFFDFRVVCGAVKLAEQLRDHVTEIVRGNVAFLVQMAWMKAQRSASVGLFGRLFADDGERADAVDLKLRGTLPLTNVVRLLALKEGIALPGTLDRLVGLRDTGVLTDEDASRWRADFELMEELLLRRQIQDVAAGRPASNLIDPNELERRQRRALIETLRHVDRIVSIFLRDRLGPVPVG